ncbi:MAG: VanZ family protein [Gemmatimonadota bacterium]
MKRYFLAYLPAALWAVVVLIIGGQDQIGVPRLPVGVDKVAHLVLYAILGALTAWGWLRSGRRPGAAWPILLVIALGAVDEARQLELSGRSAEIMDWLADAAGAFTAYAIVVARANRRRREEDADEP